MSFFHKFPYENFHELNLDWILGEIQKFDAELTEFEETATELFSESLVKYNSLEQYLNLIPGYQVLKLI